MEKIIFKAALAILIVGMPSMSQGAVALVTKTPVTTSASLLFGNSLTITPNVQARPPVPPKPTQNLPGTTGPGH